MLRAIVIPLLFCVLSVQAADRKPNILFIMGDDHAAFGLGSYGNTKVSTPNLDKLAAQGQRFTRAYCNSPVCTPSRQSLITGRLPHGVGVTQLTTPLAEAEITLADHLSARGYHCASFGKMHFNNRLQHGFTPHTDYPEVPKRKADAPPLPEKEIFPPWKPFKDPASIWLNSARLPQPMLDAESGATKIADAAAAYLAQPREKPFFLMASFHQPHSPFQFPADFAGRVDPASIELPADPLPHERDQVPLIFRDLTPEQKRGIAAAYYTSVNYLDTKIGQVLAALEKSGQAENTVVFYFSDHGYTLGHHGRFEKHCLYEEAVRVPLIVRWPGRVKAGTESDAMLELVDLFPTVCAIADADLPAQRDGKSFLPVLTGEARTHRDFVVSQYNENEELMIRTAVWKLMYCTGRRERQDGYLATTPAGKSLKLFNMKDDPGETNNRAGEADPKLLQELQEKLGERLESAARAEDRAGRGGVSPLDYYAAPYELRAK